MSRVFRTLIPAIAPIFLLAAAGLAQPLDPTFTYQGDLATAGLPATGLHDMRFRLYTAATGGTQLGSTLCLDNVSVIDGKFAALLNFGAQFAGQKRFLEIEVRADSGANCTVSTGFSILSPRQELTAAPNASYTLNAGLLEGSDGAFYRNASNMLTGTLADARLSTNIPKLNAANVFTGAVTASAFTGSGASLTGLNATNIAAGTLADARLSTNVPKLNAVSNIFTGVLTATGFTGSGATLTGLDATSVTAGTLADARLSANIVRLNSATNLFTGALSATSFTGSGAGLTGLNAANIATGLLSDARLSSNIPRLNAPAAFTSSVSALAFSGSGALLTGLNANNISAGSLSDARLSANVAMRDGANLFTNPLNAFSGALGVGTSSPTRQLTVVADGYGFTHVNAAANCDITTYLEPGLAYIGTVNPVDLGFFTGDSLIQMKLSTQGWLGIGAQPSAMLDVADEVRVQGGAIRKGGSPIETTDLGLYSDGAGQWMRFATSGGAFRFYSDFANGSAAGPISAPLLTIEPNGRTGIGLNVPLARLHVDIANAPGTGQAAGLFSVETCGAICGQTAFIEAIRAANLNGNGRVGIGFLNGAVNTNGVANAWIGTADGAASGHIVFATRTNGVLTEQARIRSDGITEVKAIQINGGADIVEGFDSSQGELEPGTVVVIDPEHPGSLKQSDGEYDTKVAGIVSGAGGINPGLHLGQKGTLDGQTRVAMTGRVYVKCSAAAGAIKPGDLLTTASIAGHAMKAADSTRSQGSVIGKAMTSLDGGEGLVLVLVNLQ